ncbi:MAG: hypothetical protein J6Y37_05630, partial [Paludibacteraceae bacterium]|nr:hypothetical protein [Paludibacteraceae bacterium]
MFYNVFGIRGICKKRSILHLYGCHRYRFRISTQQIRVFLLDQQLHLVHGEVLDHALTGRIAQSRAQFGIG